MRCDTRGLWRRAARGTNEVNGRNTSAHMISRRLYFGHCPRSSGRPEAGGPQATSVYLRASVPPLWVFSVSSTQLLLSDFGISISEGPLR